MPSKGREWRTGRVIGKSSATYQLVRSSSEAPSSSWWKVYPAAFVCRDYAILTKASERRNCLFQLPVPLGGEDLVAGAELDITLQWQLGSRERRGSGNQGRNLLWSHHSLGSGAEMVNRHRPEEMNCQTTRWVSHKWPGLNSSSRFHLNIRTGMLFSTDKQVFPSSNINLRQKQICRMCSLPTFTSKPL